MKTSQAILEIIKNKSTPIDFDEVNAYCLKQGLKSNKTTIYRNLETLEKSQTIKKVILSGQKQFWELAQADSQDAAQHLHLICQGCAKIECKIVPKIQLPNFNFSIKSLDINLFGLCKECA